MLSSLTRARVIHPLFRRDSVRSPLHLGKGDLRVLDFLLSKRVVKMTFMRTMTLDGQTRMMTLGLVMLADVPGFLARNPAMAKGTLQMWTIGMHRQIAFVPFGQLSSIGEVTKKCRHDIPARSLKRRHMKIEYACAFFA
jgi:hypothetical protein